MSSSWIREQFPLHYLVWNNGYDELEKLLAVKQVCKHCGLKMQPRANSVRLKNRHHRTVDLKLIPMLAPHRSLLLEATRKPRGFLKYSGSSFEFMPRLCEFLALLSSPLPIVLYRNLLFHLSIWFGT